MSSRMLHVLLALALALPAMQARAGDAPAGPLVQVFCGSSGGFAPPEVGDSIKDLQRALQRKDRTLRLVASPDQADLLLEVTGRQERGVGPARWETKSTRSGSSYKTTTRQVQDTVKVVSARLRAGSFALELEGTDVAFWGSAAGNLASQVEKWVKQNQEELLAHRVGERP